MSLLFLTFLAQAAPTTPAAPGAPGVPASPLEQLFASPIVFMVLIGVVFYFLLIRPQQKKQKEQLALINAVKTGDKVITTAGIHGLVSNVKDTTVIVKIADNVKVELEKSAIASVTKRSEIETATVS